MNKLGLFGLILLLSSCGAHVNSAYKKLSGPEKRWVILHPFKAKKAFPAATQALKTSDSLAKLNQIDADNNGGSYDAFKHSYWMAKTAQLIGLKSAIKLGKAHEKGNYKSFKRGKIEDGILPDKPSSDMDLHNNQIGANLGVGIPITNNQQLVKELLSILDQGQLLMILKNKEGQFLTCDKKIIPVTALKSQWDNEKCLIPSILDLH